MKGEIFLMLKKKLKKSIATLLMGLSLVSVSSMANQVTAEANPMEVPTVAVENLLTNYIQTKNSSLSAQEADVLAKNIIYYSYKYNVDPLVMTSLIDAESTFHQTAVSPVGAIGLGQIMPDTAVALGINPWDAAQNVEGACSYLSTQIKNFSHFQYPVEMALAAYNAGPNAVREYGGIPPYRETQNYVSKIRDKYFSLYNNLAYALNNYQYTPARQNDVVSAYSSYTDTGSETNYVSSVVQDYTNEIYDIEDDFDF